MESVICVLSDKRELIGICSSLESAVRWVESQDSWTNYEKLSVIYESWVVCD